MSLLLALLLVLPPGREQALLALVEGVDLGRFELESVAVERTIVRYTLLLEGRPAGELVLHPSGTRVDGRPSRSFDVVLAPLSDDAKRVLGSMADAVVARDRGGFYVEVADAPRRAGEANLRDRPAVPWREAWLARLRVPDDLDATLVRWLWRLKLVLLAVAIGLAARAACSVDRPMRPPDR